MDTPDRTRQIVELGHEAIHACDLGELESLSLPALERIFLAESSVFLDWRNSGNNKWAISDIHLPQEWSNSYRKLYFSTLRRQDPIFEWLDTGRFTQALSATRLSSLIDRREFEKGAFYNELLREVDCRHILTMALHCGEGLIANISLLRTSKQRNFDKEDERLARVTALCLGGTAQRLAAPKHQHASSIILTFDRHLTPGRLEIGDAWEGPAINLDSPTDIREFLDKTDRIKTSVRQAQGPFARRRRLASHPEDIVTLASSERVTAKLQVRWNRKKNPLFTVTIRKDPNIVTESPLAKLTYRELQITQLAATGMSSKEIGEQLCISSWTVKNHLKAIYAKTGVNNRACLARLLN